MADNHQDDEAETGPETGPETGQETAIDGGSGGQAKAYWRANLRLLCGLMSIWFLASFGAGILFRDFLDQFMLGGFPLGFWFAQQGSIYIFIALIVFYAWKMHRIERHYALDDDEDTSEGENPSIREDQ